MKSLMTDLNGKWHERGLQVFMVIVLAHWAEHIFQMVQIFVLNWPRPQALGALGLVFPWLVQSEWLHYIYALLMLIGLIILRPGFQGRARFWWNVSLGIQVWHHFEHLLLLGQAITHHNLFGAAVPTSVLQLFFPRVELHMFYNTIVFIPMMIGMYYHLRPPASENVKYTCTCNHQARTAKPTATVSA